MAGGRRIPGWGIAVAVVAAASIGRIAASWGLDAPWIAPDEPTYGLLGRSLWASGHLTMLGHRASFYGIVYPAFAGLPLHAFGSVTGVRVLQALQPVVMATAGIVVYGWARTLVSSRAALLAAVLSLALPAFAYAGLIMTESAYYPIATLALWALARALERPSIERQAVAISAILLAALTRLQALALLLALVGAVLSTALFERSTSVVRRFALTLGLMVVAGAIIVGVHSAGASGDVLGAYTTTAHSSYEVGPALRWIVWHAADVFLLVAGAPLLAFVVLLVDAARGRERDVRARALLAVSASYTAVTVVQVGVFASRFSDTLLERNLVTVAPPLFVAFALWLHRGAPRPQPSTTVACLVAATPALALPAHTLTDAFSRPDSFSAAPFDHVLDWSSEGWVRALWVGLVLAVLLVFVAVPRRLAGVLAGLTIAVLVGVSAVASNDVHRLAAALERQLFGRDVVTWVDRSADGPVTYLDAGGRYWNEPWMTAFWNRRITRVASLADAAPGPIPPNDVVSARFDGIVFTRSGTTLDTHWVVAPDRLTLVGTPVRSIVPETDVGRLTLWHVAPPARLSMLRSGFQPNGDVQGAARVEVFSCSSGRLDVTLLGKDGSPVLLGAEGGRTVRYTTAGKDVVHASIPAPLGPGETGPCRFWIETPGLVGTTTISFVPAS